jgi:hypothetical protein
MIFLAELYPRFNARKDGQKHAPARIRARAPTRRDASARRVTGTTRAFSTTDLIVTLDVTAGRQRLSALRAGLDSGVPQY